MRVGSVCVRGGGEENNVYNMCVCVCVFSVCALTTLAYLWMTYVLYPDPLGILMNGHPRSCCLRASD